MSVIPASPKPADSQPACEFQCGAALKTARPFSLDVVKCDCNPPPFPSAAIVGWVLGYQAVIFMEQPLFIIAVSSACMNTDVLRWPLGVHYTGLRVHLA